MPTLSFRPLAEGDADTIASYWHDLTSADCDRMGIAADKLPSREVLADMMRANAAAGTDAKAQYRVCTVDGEAVGCGLVTDVKPDGTAEFHFHLWERSRRGQGLARPLVEMLLGEFARSMGLTCIIMQPAVSNKAADHIAASLAPLVKRQIVPASGIVREIEVNRYEWRPTR